jgi:nucleotide-binding universal stress UspA family protein
MIRSILVHADQHPAMAARTETALGIARTHGAHVSFHVNAPLYPLVSVEPFAGAVIPQALIDDVRRQADDQIAAIGAKLADEDVPWHCETSELDLLDALIRSARFADLVVVSIAATGGGARAGSASLAGALALHARCPVLALPDALPPQRLDGPAMIAWDGSAEAAHALRAAVPLLARASDVHLVTITEKEARFPADDALRYLSRHDIHADFVEQPRGGHTVEEALDRAAEALGADLVVMGAYGHSRVRETLFGGVTRYAIASTRRPLLLMH